MDVLVLGAGVIGLTTAHTLARDGHRVIVIDKRAGPALEGSYANGGQLSYDHASPMASSSMLWKIPHWLFSSKAPIILGLQPDLAQWTWLARFVRACNPRDHQATTDRLLALSDLSRNHLHAFLRQHDPNCDWRQSGRLIVHSTERDMEMARRAADYKNERGRPMELLTKDEVLEREPTLEHIAGRLVGGVFASQEETADCYQFCREIQRIIEEPPFGVEFYYNTRVTQLVRVGKRIVGANTPDGLIEADAIVLALGNEARALTLPLGYDPPIYPVKGYSVSLNISDDTAAPQHSVTDFVNRVVYARLHNRLRVAGMADITDRSNDFDEGRLDQLVQLASRTFPAASHHEKLDPWCGLRPSTPTGWPVIGRSRNFNNLFFNMGHGMLGFTLAFGSAQLTADLVGGRGIPPEFYEKI